MTNSLLSHLRLLGIRFRTFLESSRTEILSHSSSLKALFILVAMAMVIIPADADVRLPRIFGDHMVLQRGMKLPVWGWADAGEKLTLTLKGRGLDIKIDTTADGGGKWRCELPVLKAGGPYVMTVTGNNAVTFNNVM
ncbi:MAG: hypothetical protein QGG01_05355, partial [Roseibacillus sp.]|nr:hypothetical protein [Roseibacillus sp.]